MSSESVPPVSASDEQLPAVLTGDEKMWAMFCHLSTFLGYLVGGLTFIGPLVCWLMKKDSSKFVDDHGKESLNCQLNILIYTLISIPLMFICIGFFTLAAVHIYSIVAVVIAGIKANNGEVFRYPFIFRLIK